MKINVSLITIIVLVLIVASSTYVIFNPPVVYRHHVIVGYVRPNSTSHIVSQNMTGTNITNINDLNVTIIHTGHGVFP